MQAASSTPSDGGATWAARCTVRRAVADGGRAFPGHPQGADLCADGRHRGGPDDVAAERSGGVRNWDYRYCWIRDATFTLYALMLGGFTDEAQAWREWLLRAVAGMPSQIQIMYGLAGERRLTELELGWLPGYEGAAPVRIGNAAHRQRQLDVFGEVMDALHVARREGLPTEENAWRVQRDLLRYLETVWAEPDEGIWEMRGPRRHFTHSKVMAWVALDRAVKGVERFGLEGRRRPVARPPRHDPRRGVREGVRPGPPRLRPVLRGNRAGRQPAHDAAGRLLAAVRPPRSRDGGGGGARAAARRVRAALPDAARRRRAPAR